MEDVRYQSSYFLTSGKTYGIRVAEGFTAALAVLITGASQSRQHGKSEPPVSEASRPLGCYTFLSSLALDHFSIIGSISHTVGLDCLTRIASVAIRDVTCCASSERMDWLLKHATEIVCHEKVARIPLVKGKVLQVQGERTKENLKSLKSTKADEQNLEDILIVRDFPDVFPKDLSGLPPHRKVEFRIDLVPRATPIVKSPIDWHLQKCKSCQNNSKIYKIRVLFDQVTLRGEHLYCLSRRRMVHSGCV
ncbi:hypothetical protein Tco_1010280 [Tanacetum coccineum]